MNEVLADLIAYTAIALGVALVVKGILDIAENSQTVPVYLELEQLPEEVFYLPEQNQIIILRANNILYTEFKLGRKDGEPYIVYLGEL